MKLFSTIVLALVFTCALTATKEDLQKRSVELLGRIEDAVKGLLIDSNSNEEDIESLRFEEDAVRTILKELQKPDLTSRLLNLLVTKLDDIETETDELLKRMLGTTPVRTASTATSNLTFV